MSWPSGQDYREAIQSPTSAFLDNDLRNCAVECDKLGLPRPRSGGFATVYKVIGHKIWAVRCFNRELKDQQERYMAISGCLQALKLPYIVDFAFLEEGIRVKGRWYPILKMEWVAGDPLNIFVEKNLKNPHALVKLAQNWITMMGDLHRAGIAHGDLQHGNILVVGSTLKLVDYDGMYVPSLRGKLSNESGQPNYQLPMRGPADFGPYLDNFSAWVILISLLALAKEPSLWQSFQGGDECLLFRKRDFVAPDQSSLFHKLEQSRDSQVAALTNLFRTFLFLGCSTVPSLDSSLTPSNVPEAMHEGPAWIKDHLQRSTQTAKPSSQIPNVALDWVLDFSAPTPPPIHITGDFVLERSLLWMSSAIIISLLFLASWIWICLTALLMVALNSISLRRAYAKQPALRAMEELLHALKENKRQVGNIQASLKKADQKRQEIRQEQLRVRAKFKEREHEIDKHENKLINDTRKTCEDRINPLIRERREIDSRESAEMSTLQNGLGKKVTGMKAALANSNSGEAAELASALQSKQMAFVKAALSSSRIYDANIPGIGDGFMARLHAAGIRTADDVDYYAVQRVPGIGVKKATALSGWKHFVENDARRRMPQALSTIEEMTIRNKYSLARITCQNDLAQGEIKLRTEETQIRDRYAGGKQKIDAQMALENIKLNEDISRIVERGKAEKVQIAKQAQETGMKSDEQVRNVEKNIQDLTRELASMQWKRAKLERESQRYANVRVSKFLRTVAFGR